MSQQFWSPIKDAVRVSSIMYGPYNNKSIDFGQLNVTNVITVSSFVRPFVTGIKLNKNTVYSIQFYCLSIKCFIY